MVRINVPRREGRPDNKYDKKDAGVDEEHLSARDVRHDDGADDGHYPGTELHEGIDQCLVLGAGEANLITRILIDSADTKES